MRNQQSGSAYQALRIALGGTAFAAGLDKFSWLLAIAANLISSGEYFDIAARDVNMAVAAYALARLSSARAEASRVGVWDKIQKAT